MWKKTVPESTGKDFLEKLGSEDVLEKNELKDYRGIMLKGHDIALICVNSVSPGTQRTRWGHRKDTVQNT